LRCPESALAKEALAHLEEDADYSKMEELPLLTKCPPINNRKAYKKFMRLKYEISERASQKTLEENNGVEDMLDDRFHMTSEGIGLTKDIEALQVFFFFFFSFDSINGAC
jgi:hypothetical protein